MNTRKMVWLGTAIAATAIWAFNLIRYDKIGAMWGNFSVIVMALVIGAILGLMLFLLPWFQDTDEPAPRSFFIIILGAFSICLVGGIFMTEPAEPGAQYSRGGVPVQVGTNEYREESYARSRAGGSFYYSFYGSNVGSSGGSVGSSSSVSIPKCSGKACSGLALVFLIIVALIMIIGSFFVPHFWVVGTFVFLLFLWEVAIRELSVPEYSYEYDYKAKNW